MRDALLESLASDQHQNVFGFVNLVEIKTMKSHNSCMSVVAVEEAIWIQVCANSFQGTYTGETRLILTVLV